MLLRQETGGMLHIEPAEGKERLESKWLVEVEIDRWAELVDRPLTNLNLIILAVSDETAQTLVVVLLEAHFKELF